ncbi:hypothetical protein DdX_19730 [Ditylenchus destructor]|uniref:Uncharacterized protein n=1 Tax=Ditylenchus destructor TaxID=166010 RepID=A0AAD4QWW0_9BILA|nr:hypothetical protein DdX_19730 [Ditylenchus destructor]
MIETGVSCPRNDEQRNQCATSNAKPFVDQCRSKFDRSSRGIKDINDAKEFCRAKSKTVECIYKEVELICGNTTATKYIKDAMEPVDVRYCPYCNKVIDFMENLGVHLARKDDKSYCRKADCEISSLKAQLDKKCTFENSTREYEKLCSDMYSATLCANDTVVTQCGDLFGDEYMRRNYTPPNVYPCWHCKQMIIYMSKFNKTVRQIDINGTLLGTTCPLNFTSDCAEKNAQPMIQECKNLQIPSNLSLIADSAFSKNVCRSIYESVKCIHEQVSDVCGEAAANETIKTMEFKTLADNCAYCTDAINITEKYGGRLRIESDNGKSEHCVRPDCTKRQLNITIRSTEKYNLPQLRTPYEDYCRKMLEYAKNVSDFVKNVCYGDRAAEYMRDEIEIKVYPCAYCTELVEFMGKRDGKVYQADKNNNPVVVRSVNMKCPATQSEVVECSTYNAKNFVDECKEVFYEATSFGHGNESVGVKFCSDLYVMLKCIHDEVKAICGHSVAKRYMKSEMYPEVRSDMCEDCNASVTFMEQFGGRVYIRDQPGNQICKLNKTTVKKKPVSSAKCYYASGFFIHVLYFIFVFMHSVLQIL